MCELMLDRQQRRLTSSCELTTSSSTPRRSLAAASELVTKVEHDVLKADHEKLKEEHRTLKSEVSYLRRALMELMAAGNAKKQVQTSPAE